MYDKMKTGMMLVGLVTLRFMTPCVVPAEDVVIISPILASASTYYSSLYAPQWMVNGSGLTGTGGDATHTNKISRTVRWNKRRSA